MRPTQRLQPSGRVCAALLHQRHHARDGRRVPSEPLGRSSPLARVRSTLPVGEPVTGASTRSTPSFRGRRQDDAECDHCGDACKQLLHDFLPARMTCGGSFTLRLTFVQAGRVPFTEFCFAANARLAPGVACSYPTYAMLVGGPCGFQRYRAPSAGGGGVAHQSGLRNVPFPMAGAIKKQSI